MQYSISYKNMYKCRANKDIYNLHNYIIGYTIYISIADRLYNSPLWSSLFNALSILCMHQILGGLGGLLGELPLLLLVLRRIWTWGLLLLLNLGACILGAPKFTLAALGVLSTFHQVYLFAAASTYCIGI